MIITNVLSNLTTGDWIAICSVIVAIAGSIIIPIYIHKRSQKEDKDHVSVERIVKIAKANGIKASATHGGTVVQNVQDVNNLSIQQGLQPEILFDKTLQLQADNTRLQIENQELKEKDQALERIQKLEAQGNRPDADEAIEQYRESGDTTKLLALLIEERNKHKEQEISHREERIKLNREITAVAFLKGDIEIAKEAVEEILKILPDDLFALNQRGRIYYLQGNLMQAETDCKKILQLAKDQKDDSSRAGAYGNLGLIYRIRGELDKAEQAHQNSLEIFENLGQLVEVADAYSNLGVIYRIRGDLDQAKQMQRKSLEINQKLKRLKGIAINYGNLGTIYQSLGELDKAEHMYKHALDINLKLDQLEGMATQYGNLGLIYEIKGELDKAEQMLNKALEINQRLGRLEGIVIQYGNLGVVYRKQGNIDKAEQMHIEALAIAEKLGHKELLANNYGNLGAIYELRMELDKAKEYMQKSLQLFKQIDMRHEVKMVQGWLDEIEKKKNGS